MNRVRLALLAVLVLGAYLVFLAVRPHELPMPQPAPAPAPAAAPSTPEPEGALAFAVVAAVDDRWVAEPCSRVPGGGLWSLAAFFDAVRADAAEGTTVVPVMLGDLTHVPGLLGRDVVTHHWYEVVTQAEPQVVAAGPGELALGAEYARGALSRLKFTVLCANAGDASGAPILRSWALGQASGRCILYVSAASTSLQDGLADAGSDVRILPVRSAVESSVRDAEAEAKRIGRPIAVRVLLHHGTVDETAEILRAVPGFTMAFAARGGDLPDDEPSFEGDVPVFQPGRGLRFGWVVTVDRGRAVRWGLVRIGIELLSRGSPVSAQIDEQARIVRDIVYPAVTEGADRRVPDPRGAYVGSQACAACHTEQAGAHSESSHRALPASFPADGLGRAQCLACHVTGAFRRTGWRGREDRSDLAGVSCEACHGPGQEHAAEPKAGWGRVALTACRSCHTPDRSPEFDAEALWKQWGHGQR